MASYCGVHDENSEFHYETATIEIFTLLSPEVNTQQYYSSASFYIFIKVLEVFVCNIIYIPYSNAYSVLHSWIHAVINRMLLKITSALKFP
jgi:uncharacterized protein (DUF2461 family)